jgi:hypothetical protein
MLPVDPRDRFQFLALRLLRILCRPRIYIHPHIRLRLNTHQCRFVPIWPSQCLKDKSPMRHHPGFSEV